MEKQQNRRNFLKKISVGIGLSQLHYLAWSEGLATLLNEGINPAGEFSLLKLEKLLPDYLFPFVDKFSTGSFKSHYTLFNLYGNAAVKAGELSLSSVSEGIYQKFDFVSSRLANDGIKDRKQIFKYVVSGDIQCKNDITLTPQKWNVSSGIFQEDGKAYGGTAITSIGKIISGEIQINTGSKIIRKNIDNKALSWKWGLIAVAQRMSEESINEIQFATLDEFDALYKNQKLKFQRKVALDCGSGHILDFKVFHLTGDGVIPTVYWIDNQNRTVFVISGMEACLLYK
jgi:hypothetical protein